MKFRKAIAYVAIFDVILYLGISFVETTINFVKWSEDARMALVVLTMVSCIAGPVVVSFVHYIVTTKDADPEPAAVTDQQIITDIFHAPRTMTIRERWSNVAAHYKFIVDHLDAVYNESVVKGEEDDIKIKHKELIRAKKEHDYFKAMAEM